MYKAKLSNSHHVSVLKIILNSVNAGDSFVRFCCFTSQVNSYGHCGTGSSPNNTFSWAGLKRLTSNSCTYFRY